MPGKNVTRRQFARQIAISATAVPLTGCLPDSSPTVLANESDAKKKHADKSETSSDPADLLLSVVKQQYPHENLTDEVLAKIRSDIRYQLRMSRTLSKFPLKNADEPAFVFSAYRNDGAH
ncbi:MAG: hypothetical protein Tsb009_00180 [Planctomycetaceae bacterium]